MGRRGHPLVLVLDRIHLVELEGTSGRAAQRTELTDDQAHIYTACQVPPPPLLHALEPVSGHRRGAPGAP